MSYAKIVYQKMVEIKNKVMPDVVIDETIPSRKSLEIIQE
jgi:hypothetical protein